VKTPYLVSMKFNLHLTLLFSFLFVACGTERSDDFGTDISQDSDKILKGKSIFEMQCSSCHNFEQSGIGPNLSGLTRQADSEWIKTFIQNPTEAIDRKDPRAVQLFETYNTYMPAFPNLDEAELDAVLSYLHTFETLPDTSQQAGLEDPIPDSIPDSGIQLDLEFFAQVPASDTISPLAKITKLESEPNSGRTFIHDQHGILYELVDNQPTIYLPLKELRPKLISKPGLATGFGSYAFHPDFPENGLLYTTHTEPRGTATADFSYADSINVLMQWVLTEWKTPDPDAATFEGEGRELFRLNVVTQIHGVQEITFNPHAKKGDEDVGLLYIGIGDGGSTESGFAFISDHHGTKIWSSILRIDPKGSNSTNGKYGIPETNPFVGQEGKALELYAYGFRNPNRIFWDEQGRLFATEIGQHQVEEINHIEKGAFYGWPQREGSFIINPSGNMSSVFPLKDDPEEDKFAYPILELDHDELAAIIGGYFMQSGPLKGKFLFGDIPSGRLLYADLSDLDNVKVQTWGVNFEGKPISLRELCGNNRVDLKFGQDKTGQMYLMTKADGKIYKIK